uniref:Sjogrens syndrome scleroderma autoantigen 1 n=2 Tax=Parastrongyloides trichosuri TaxID=131310 RepID=A0A0N5A571_PARTI
MVRRHFKPKEEILVEKMNENDSNDEFVVGNIIKEIPLNEPPKNYDNLIDRELLSKRQFSEEVSEKMGEMMLQGYSMLNECCDACGNVLLANKRKEKGCVACAMIIAKELDEVNNTSKQCIIDGEEVKKFENISKGQEKSLSDKISSRMGDLLIKGHRMLDEYCKVCMGVLMEDPKTNSKDCIACIILNQDNETLQQSNKGELVSTKESSSNQCGEIITYDINFDTEKKFALEAVAKRLHHASSILGNCSSPMSSKDILIYLEIIKNCFEILRENGAII